MRGYEYPNKTTFKHPNGVTWLKEDSGKYRYISEGLLVAPARDTYDYDQWDWASDRWEIVLPKESLFDKLYERMI